MKISEIEKFKVNCIVTEAELAEANVSLDDIMERKPEGWTYIRKLRTKAIESTGYAWPDCAYSMQISVIEDGSINFIFAETVADFVAGLRTSQVAVNNGSDLLSGFIAKLEQLPEDEAREYIKKFELSVRAQMENNGFK